MGVFRSRGCLADAMAMLILSAHYLTSAESWCFAYVHPWPRSSDLGGLFFAAAVSCRQEVMAMLGRAENENMLT